MIEKIAHLADIHVRKIPTRNNEYEAVFKNLVESLQNEKPDRIVIVGDLVHDYIDLQGEQLILVSNFLNALSDIAPVRITRGNHDCYTGEHEILTKNGWLTFKEYIDNNLNLDVLTFNDKKNELVFQKPTDLIKNRFAGNMQHIITDKCSFTVTPTHEILLYQYSKNKYIKKYAKDISINSDLRIPIRSNEIIDDNDSWFNLLGFCLADATFVVKNENTMNGRVQFHLKKERKINYLCDLLTNLSIPYTCRIGDKKRNTKVISIYSDFAKKIMEFFSYEKELHYENLLCYNKVQLKSFIDGYLNGDGSHVDNYRYACATIFKNNACVLTTIANYVGYYGYVQDSTVFGNYENSKQQHVFFITKNNKNKTSKIKKIIDVPYDDFVYCLTVPNENLLIRYNGNMFIGGNCRKKNLNRTDSIKAVVEILHNENIIYYDKTGFYEDENIMWAVWHHGEAKNNPWKLKEAKKLADKDIKSKYTFIDLFHDPISSCKSTTGFEMKSKLYYNISDFKGDLSFFGDIHRTQFLDKKQTKGFSGSLIAQDFSEGDDNFHGYLLWNINNKTVGEIPIHNNYSFKNIHITPYTDFDDLDFEIDNPTEYMKIRFIWGTLPQTRTKDVERKIIEYVKTKYNNCVIIHITHKNEFLESEKIDIKENVTLQNITDKSVQHEIFKEYLIKIGTDDKVIADIIALDEEILKEIDAPNDDSVEWNIIKFGGNNFMSYEKIDIDWRDMDGLFQIAGNNAVGKTTIMKLISYILFGKTLETETRMKFGDLRFINNRNDANSCDAYLVLEANGEYYGIKKKTEIEKMRDGSIKAVPTTLSYYALSNPDEEMNDTTALEKLDEDRRAKTQQKIDSIIGTYENFMRIVMTTSDTLNRILSNDMAIFIDSLLFDSGLDIFDKKHEALKLYQKKINERPRVNCNIESITQQNITLAQEINNLKNEISEIGIVTLPTLQNRISNGRTYIETLTKKLYKIDNEIYNLDVNKSNEIISTYRKNINDLKAREDAIEKSIANLKESYDEIRLTELLKQKEEHKTNEYKFNLEIKDFERKIDTCDYEIQVINGKIHRLKEEGLKLKNEILELKNSKICPLCNQQLLPEHQAHIDNKIKEKENSMFEMANEIKNYQSSIELNQRVSIKNCQNEINKIKTLIEEKSLQMEEILIEIGNLTNDKNDVEKRKELQNELNLIPTRIQNEELRIDVLQQKINNHDNSLKQIEENHIIEKGILAAKDKVKTLVSEEDNEKENLYIKKTQIGEKQLKIKENETLIAEFKVQEYRDMIMGLYKKCVHRDGIPRQMLCNYIIPKINLTLENILSVAPFKVWLDVDDLRPKLAYNSRPQAIIDCISASGKERTFSSVVLKFALNQINVKAKPMMFLLDEVMGKLDLEGSVEEFVEILQMIKSKMKKVLVIEQMHEIDPDYIIKVELNDDGISSIKIE